MRVCLASTSPARLALLRQSGIEPICVSPDVDEDAVAAAEAERLGRPLAPEEVVLLLGRAKAAEVAGRIHELHPRFEGIVIGGDSMFEIDGAVHGKPYEPERAIARWHAMRGRTGVLHSGHSVILVRSDAPAEEVHAVAEASVTFAADVDDAEIEAYVATGEPLLVAGAFTVDSLGGAFIERVEGDPSTVVGMSLSTLRRLTGRLGIRWTDLWNAVPGAS